MFFSFQQSRLVTFDNTSTPAALFIKSLPHTGFNKVYRNNMDEQSFISDINVIIEHMFLDTRTAAFITESAGISTEEYSNCCVSIHIHLSGAPIGFLKSGWTLGKGISG